MISFKKGGLDIDDHAVGLEKALLCRNVRRLGQTEMASARSASGIIGTSEGCLGPGPALQQRDMGRVGQQTRLVMHPCARRVAAVQGQVAEVVPSEGLLAGRQGIIEGALRLASFAFSVVAARCQPAVAPIAFPSAARAAPSRRFFGDHYPANGRRPRSTRSRRGAAQWVNAS